MSRAGRGRNECEICGFVPYTKNKYREKSDHLAKFHFKERIDALMPKYRPYDCPGLECSYQGKDKQDVLRHYTGKHNILKKWVDDFIREQSGDTPETPRSTWVSNRQADEVPGDNPSGEGLTFREMEGRAIACQPVVQEPRCREIRKPAEPPSVSPDVIEVSKVVLTHKGQQTSFTISKVPRDGVEPSPPPPTTSSSISLIRLTKPPVTTPPIASSLLLTMAKSSPTPKVSQVRCKFCPAGQTRQFASIGQWKDHCLQEHPHLQGTLWQQEQTTPLPKVVDNLVPPCTAKTSCGACSMAFPSDQALSLHKEVCLEMDQEGEDEVVYLEEEEEISIKEEAIMIEDNTQEPPKKKARRPPPALIPI